MYIVFESKSILYGAQTTAKKCDISTAVNAFIERPTKVSFCFVSTFFSCFFNLHRSSIKIGGSTFQHLNRLRLQGPLALQ